MSETPIPRSDECCGGVGLHEALRREFQSMVLRPEWPAVEGIHVVVTTREGPRPTHVSPYGFNVGSRCGDEPALVARNRAFLREALGLPAEPYWLRQVHGTRCIDVGAAVPMVEPEADAAVARAAGVVLAIQTADCLPVLFAADDASEIAAAHAGWRGLCADVLENTLAMMHAPRGNIMAWLGPAIAAASYEVGDEVRAAFVAHDPDAASAFTATRPGHWSCDLYTLARLRLHAAGVARVFGGTLDTFADARLHSYRRDGSRSGRMASLIWLASPQAGGRADA